MPGLADAGHVEQILQVIRPWSNRITHNQYYVNISTVSKIDETFPISILPIFSKHLLTSINVLSAHPLSETGQNGRDHLHITQETVQNANDFSA